MISLSEEEIKAKILHNIARKRQQYINKKQAIAAFPQHMKKEAVKILEKMVKEGLLKEFKKKECVGINTSQFEEVTRLLKLHRDKQYSKMY